MSPPVERPLQRLAISSRAYIKNTDLMSISVVLKLTRKKGHLQSLKAPARFGGTVIKPS